MIDHTGSKVMVVIETGNLEIPLSARDNEVHIVLYDDLRVNNNYLACY